MFLKIIPFIPGTPRTNPVHFPTRIIESPSPVLINIALSFSLGFNDNFPDILRKKIVMIHTDFNQTVSFELTHCCILFIKIGKLVVLTSFAIKAFEQIKL